MKSFVATTIAFCLLSIVLLGAFAMHYGEGMLHNGCFAAMNSNIPCAQKDWALADLHITGLKTFSLALVVITVLAIIALSTLFFHPALYDERFRVLRHLFIDPVYTRSAPRALISWLALKINSPSFA